MRFRQETMRRCYSQVTFKLLESEVAELDGSCSSPIDRSSERLW